MAKLPISVGQNEPPPATNGGLMKPPAAAEFLAIGTRKLWELTNRGEIPHVRIGRAVRYDRRDLETWIEKHKRSGPASPVVH